MRVPSIIYSNSIRNYQRKSVVKIYRKTGNGWKVLDNAKKEEISQPTTVVHNQKQYDETDTKDDKILEERSKCRENEMKIQMLSKPLYNQIFKNNKKNVPNEETINR